MSTTLVEPDIPVPHASPSGVARRRRPRLLAALVVLTVAAIGLVTLRPGDPAAMHADETLPAAVRGTYRLDDGRELTLWGSQSAPSVELGGKVTSLVADALDQFEAMDGHLRLTVERDSVGQVVGVIFQSGDDPAAFAPRVERYTEHEVTFSSAGAALAGTVLLPSGPGPHPAVAIAHGAGPVRRQQLLWGQASHLARNGVAALVYDKRGVGESTGDYATATFDDLTADLLAGVALLTGHEAVDPARVGVLGFSQGGWLVAKAAQASDDIAFVVALSPSAFTPGDQQAWLHGSMLVSRGFDDRAMTVADRVDRMLYSSLDLVDAGVMPPIPHVPGFWFHALDLHQDSSALWEGVRQPVLTAWGELDCQVPAHDSARIFAETLQRGGNDRVTLALLPGADHSLTLADECAHETGLADHSALTYADGALGLGADWITGLPDSAKGVHSTLPPAADSTVLGWHLDPPRPAPWYGSLAAQLVTLLALLATFGAVTVSWAARRTGHLPGSASLAGLLATITGFAAFTEIAMLGGTHAMFLVGGPTVAGSSALMSTARILVTLTAGLAVATAVARRSRPRGWPIWVGGGAVAMLMLWATYWQLTPVALWSGA